LPCVQKVSKKLNNAQKKVKVWHNKNKGVMQWLWDKTKDHFRQGFNQKPVDQFEANWTLSWTLLHTIIFFYGTMSVSKSLGSNSRVQYQKYAIDMRED